MNVGCIIQARTGSTRLPEKVLMKIEGKEVILHVVERLLNAKKLNKIIVATTDSKSDDKLAELIKNNPDEKTGVFRGDEEDVLDRYYQAAKEFKLDIIVRVTGDCPLIDWELIDQAVVEFEKEELDYVSNVLTKRTYPRGLDVEVFSFNVLEQMWKTTKEKREREHVTTYVREHPDEFNTKNIEQENDYSNLRWTLDEKDDLVLIEKIFAELYSKNKNFTTDMILELIKNEPELAKLNAHVEQKKNVMSSAN